MESYGIDNLKVVAVSVAEIMNIASKVMNGSGIFSLFGVMTPINKIRGMDAALALKELKDLSAPERAELDQSFLNKLDLANKDLQTKIATMNGYLEECVTLVGDGLAMISHAQDLGSRIKKLLSI